MLSELFQVYCLARCLAHDTAIDRSFDHTPIYAQQTGPPVALSATGYQSVDIPVVFALQ